MGVEDAPSAVYAEPYHQTTAALAIVLRWNATPWTTHAKVERAEAAADHAEDLADLAKTGATFEARTANADAKEAKERVAAATDGETASRAWVASVLQADAIGTAETRDLSDAYIAWFQMRARLATAIFQWNVDVVRLGRATGEFKAGAARPKETK
jgi:outer membrane protein TolC